MEFIIEYMSISVKSSSNVHTCPYTSPRVSSHLNTFPVTTCPLLTPCIAGLAVHGRGQLHQQRPRLRDHPGLRGGQAASGECLDVDWGCNEQSGTNKGLMRYNQLLIRDVWSHFHGRMVMSNWRPQVKPQWSIKGGQLFRKGGWWLVGRWGVLGCRGWGPLLKRY